MLSEKERNNIGKVMKNIVLCTVTSLYLYTYLEPDSGIYLHVDTSKGTATLTTELTSGLLVESKPVDYNTGLGSVYEEISRLIVAYESYLG